jgi:hypothetical protein
LKDDEQSAPPSTCHHHVGVGLQASSVGLFGIKSDVSNDLASEVVCEAEQKLKHNYTSFATLFMYFPHI